MLAALFPGNAAASGKEGPLAREDSTVQFNALDYSMQKRFRPKNDPFITESFFDNTFIGVSAGVFNMAPTGDSRFAFGPHVSFSVGKWINEYNAVRIEPSWRKFARKNDIAEFGISSLGVSHMFNVSSYLGGYRRSRFVEFSTVEGLTFGRSSENGGKANFAFGINLGLNMSLRLSDIFDLYIEPGITVYTDGADHSGKNNWRHYDLGYGAAIGIAANIDGTPRRKPAASETEKQGSTYVSLFAGPQIQNSQSAARNIGLFRSIGPHVGLTAGHWIRRYFALQASAFYSSDKWIRDIDGTFRQTRYAGLRVEGRLDPLAFIPGWQEKNGFSLPLLFGPEAGYMFKDDRAMKINKVYLGITAALQLRYRLTDFLYVYAEPRFSIVPYWLDFYSGYIEERGVRETYYDGLVNLNFGVELDINAFRHTSRP